MPTTIKDVAKKAGVPVATVSRTLNGKDRVKDETREKILSVVKEMSFVTNSSARTLRGSKTNIIGVIVPDISASFYSEIVKGIENKSNEYDYKIIVCDAQNNVEKEKTYIRFLYDRSIDGMIFVVPRIFEEEIMKVKENDFPVVVFGQNMEIYNIPSITVDNRQGAYNAVKHLYSHGYSKISYIGGIEGEKDYDHKERLAGYMKALEDCKLEVKEQYIENGQYCEEGGSSAFVRLLRLDNPPDAIFCANDEMALGVLKTARRNKVRIPEDVGLIGFDNIRICQYTNPSLSTVSQSTYNVGVLLCEKLLHSIDNRDSNLKNANLVLKPELVARESCGC